METLVDLRAIVDAGRPPQVNMRQHVQSVGAVSGMAPARRPLDVDELGLLLERRWEDGHERGFEEGHRAASEFMGREAERRREESETAGVLGGLQVAISQLDDVIDAQFGVVNDPENAGAEEIALRSLLSNLQSLRSEVARRGLHDERSAMGNKEIMSLFTNGLRP
jgi:hypothetical protein